MAAGLAIKNSLSAKVNEGGEAWIDDGEDLNTTLQRNTHVKRSKQKDGWHWMRTQELKSSKG